MKIRFLLFLIVLLNSCSNETQDSFIDCFSEKERLQLEQLRESFDRFINNNYNNSKIDFLKSYSEGIEIDELIFEKRDSILYKNLEKDSFIRIAYLITSIDDYLTNIPEPRRSELIKEYIGNHKEIVEFDFSKNYFKCLKSIEPKDSLVLSYIELINTVGSVSPAILSNGLIKAMNEKRGDEMFVDYIIIIEIYYFLLKTKFEKSDASSQQ